MPALAAVPAHLDPTPLARDVHVEVVSSDREFLALEPVWDRVLHSVERQHRHPFMEFDWARTWWENFGAGNALQILVARRNGEPLAVAPLMLSRMSMYGIPLRRLGFLYNCHVPRTGFIIGRQSDAVYRAIWSHLLEHRNWDLLQLCQLPETSPEFATIRRLASESGLASGMWASGASPYVPIAGAWDDYFGSLPAKHRSNLRNRLKRIGSADLETVTSEANLDGALEDSFRIEASAWKGNSGTAIACSPQLRAFYSDFARRAADRGWLRLNFLRSGDRRVAFDYSLEYENRTYLMKLGYDRECSAYAPSQLLLSLILRRAFEERHDKYDFLGEFMEWKRVWAKDSTPHAWLYVFAPGLAGRLTSFAKFSVVPFMKRVLGRA